MNAQRGQSAHKHSWLISAPGPDERIGSVVERAARLYGMTADALLGELLERDGDSKHTDRAGAAVVTAIAHAVDVPAHDLWTLRLDDHPSLLAPDARHAHCPKCWQEDLDAGRAPGYRRDWAFVLRTMCARHGQPLQLVAPFSGIVHGIVGRPSAESPPAPVLACLNAIDHFARTLEETLFSGGEWPRSWLMTAAQARRVLLNVALNTSKSEGFPPVSQLVQPSLLAGHVRVPSHSVAPVRGDAWEAFRGIGNPAVRRASLWLVGWWVCGEWPDEWRPGWVSRSPSLDVQMSAARTSIQPLRKSAPRTVRKPRTRASATAPKAKSHERMQRRPAGQR